jgi:hypothetical protein
MCHDKSWFVSQESKAKADEREPATKDQRSETVDTLLRESREHAQKAVADRLPAKEAAPAK